MAQEQKSYADIEGWGADLPLENRPGVPREKPSLVFKARGQEPVRQIAKVKIHVSPEHPGLTPVFGTSCPPRGLSGLVRDAAYRYSEGRMAHWLLLLAADRIDVVEGVLSDLTRGHIPNPIAEMGLMSELRGPRGRRVMASLALGGLGLGAMWLAFGMTRRKKTARRKSV